MNLCHLLPASLALTLCACNTTDAPAKPARTPGDGPAFAEPVVADGSLDLHFTAKTVGVDSSGDRSSAQCQLAFTATNRSQAPVKSVIAEFQVTRISDGAVIANTSTLTLPFEIPPGETKEAWGNITFDKERCDDLRIKVQVPKVAMCRTKDDSPCPAYRLTGEGVTVLE